MTPTKQYIALLDIKAVIADWQDVSINDTQALVSIQRILNQLVKDSK